MLVFIIALKSPKVSSSWEVVSQLFERTIKSICNQTCQNFEIVVVCHEKPQIEFHNPKIHYIEVDLPIPGKDSASREADKANKLLTGLAYAKKFNPSHAMIVDADDCVSKHIAKYVNQNPHSHGWYIKKGYVYSPGNKFIYLRNKAFSSLCGSGIIIKYGLHDQLFKNEYYDHKITRLKNNINLEPLPFIGAVYITQNGENIYLTHSRHSQSRAQLKKKGYIHYLRDLLQYRFLNKRNLTDFCLADSN